MTAPDGVVDPVDALIARVLSVAAVVAVALLVIGIALLAAAGIDPASGSFPVFDPGTVVADMLALRPEGFLWAGIVVVIATPIVRVVGELIGFARRGDRPLTLAALGILVVVALSVGAALLPGA